MGRKRTFDETQVLDTAMRAFWELGYKGTSIDDLAQRTGLARSSLYAAFGSKDELFTTTLELYLESRIGESLRGLEHGSEGADAIVGFFAAIAADAERGGTTFGCLAANTIAELGLRGVTQRPLLDGYRRRIKDAFAAALERAAEAGEIGGRDRRARAHALASFAIGHFIAMRGNPDSTREAREAVEAVEVLLASWAPSPAAVTV